MKISSAFLLAIFSFFHFQIAFSQTPGEWTWMHGDTIPNQPGNFGVQGIPSPTNKPPSLYEPCEWTDRQGNFWLYGGNNWQLGFYADLWKFDPLTVQWTWVKGPGVTGVSPVYGTQGSSSPLNTPGSRAWGICSCVDTSGNFWLFGGNVGGGIYNDLWKYDIAINQWTFMSGNTIPNQPGNYGVQGVPSPANLPPARDEVCMAWCDNQNNLWFYGGGYYGDLWKYSIATGWWTWMSGSNVVYPPAVYGLLGVGSTTNTPGGRWGYSHWKDSNDNFWFFGGSTNWNVDVYNDTWKYNPSTNEWTWVNGPNTANDPGLAGALCVSDSSYRPAARTESRVCWTDNCGNFWLFGGANNSGGNTSVNSDLWKYNVIANEWSLVEGMPYNFAGHHGTKGVSSPLNHPGARFGGVGWKDLNGNFWMFGGRDSTSSVAEYGTMWRYVPDTSCTCISLPTANASANNLLCPGTCTDFLNLSSNATSYQWNFSGGTPNTSTSENPSNICYNTPGVYDVTLIASNSAGSDTLIMSNYITVFPQPPPQSILQSGDTLFAIAGAVSYQWFYNGSAIPGATNYFYLAQASGDYNVVATDSNGCEVEAVINDVIAGIPYTVDSNQISIYPNPVNDKFTIQNSQVIRETASEISISNIMGEKVMTVSPLSLGEGPGGEAVDCKMLSPGLYYIEITADKKIYRTKFIKQ